VWAQAVSHISNALNPDGNDEHGQALVEVALVIPLLLLLAFGVVAVGRVTDVKMGVSAVAREEARAAALANDPGEAATQGVTRGHEVAAGYHLDDGSLQLAVSAGDFNRGGTVQASAHYTVSLGNLPLLDWAHITVGSTHRERIDLYRSFWQTGTAP
jgi:Flp pilus assembly protein TadG